MAVILVGAKGAYEVDPATLRAGGQAEVFRARSKTGRAVAIKIARGSGTPGAWLHEERALLCRLGEGQDSAAPWIVPVEDHGTSADGRPFVVLSWYDGSLHGWIQGRRPPLEARLLALEQAISAVVRLHRSPADFADVALHRDLKPQNFLVREEGGRVGVVLADLGTAKQGHLLHATANTGMFTRFYAPIEQQLPLVGAVDVSVDVHAMAATLYECLCGRLPQSLLLRETGFTPLAHELVVLAQHEGARSPQEELRFQALRRMPVAVFFRAGEAPPLTEEDRSRLRECVTEMVTARCERPEALADAVCSALVPVLEHALAALPGSRLGRPELLLAATRRAREIVVAGVRPVAVTVLAPKAVLAKRGRGGAWVMAAAAGLGLLGCGGLLLWGMLARPVAAPVATPEEAPAVPPVASPVRQVPNDKSDLTTTPTVEAPPAPAPVGTTAPPVRAKLLVPAVVSVEPAPTPPEAQPASSCPDQVSVFLLHLGSPSPALRLDGVQVASTAHAVEIRAGGAHTLEIDGPGSATCRFTGQLRDQPDGRCALAISSLPSRPLPLPSEPRLACGEDGALGWR